MPVHSRRAYCGGALCLACITFCSSAIAAPDRWSSMEGGPPRGPASIWGDAGSWTRDSWAGSTVVDAFDVHTYWYKLLYEGNFQRQVTNRIKAQSEKIVAEVAHGNPIVVYYIGRKKSRWFGTVPPEPILLGSGRDYQEVIDDAVISQVGPNVVSIGPTKASIFETSPNELFPNPALDREDEYNIGRPYFMIAALDEYGALQLYDMWIYGDLAARAWERKQARVRALQHPLSPFGPPFLRTWQPWVREISRSAPQTIRPPPVGPQPMYFPPDRRALLSPRAHPGGRESPRTGRPVADDTGPGTPGPAPSLTTPTPETTSPPSKGKPEDGIIIGPL